MKTTTREGGTRVHTCDTAAEVAEACRDVLANGYAKVNSEMMDATTASMVVRVWEKLNETNAAKFSALFATWKANADGRTALRAMVGFFWKAVRT